MGEEQADGNGPTREEVTALLRAISTLRTGIMFVCMVIWAVIGFLFWIPMLCHAIARFSALVVYTTIVGSNPDKLAIHLEHTMRFYLQGFDNIIRAIYASPQSHSEEGLGFTIHWGVVILHTLGVLVFWAILVLLGLWAGGVFKP